MSVHANVNEWIRTRVCVDVRMYVL